MVILCINTSIKKCSGVSSYNSQKKHLDQEVNPNDASLRSSYWKIRIFVSYLVIRCIQYVIFMFKLYSSTFSCDNLDMELFSISISSPPEVLLGKLVLKICSKFTGEHPGQSAISVKLLCNLIQFALLHRCSPVNLLHIFRTSFPKNTSGGLLLYFNKPGILSYRLLIVSKI